MVCDHKLVSQIKYQSNWTPKTMGKSQDALEQNSLEYEWNNLWCWHVLIGWDPTKLFDKTYSGIMTTAWKDKMGACELVH